MRLALVLALSFAPATALAGNPWEELMGPGKGKLWTDPEGRFYLDLPVGWNAAPRPGSSTTVDIIKQHPDTGWWAKLSVEMRGIPPNVKTAHFANRVSDDAKKSVSAYKLIETSKIQVSGRPAIRTYFTFRELNNAELLSEAVQIVFLAGERAFILTFVAAAGTREVFWEDYEKMIKSFSGRAPGDDSSPMPKQRKRVRAGEMVNPDAVQY